MKTAAVLLAAFLIYSLPFFYSDQVLSPDDYIFLHFARQLGEEGSLVYTARGDQIFDRDGFVPRYFVYREAGRALPRKHPGFILFWAPFFRLLPFTVPPAGPAAARLINPLCGAAGVGLLYLIARILFREKGAALAAACLLATTPVFLKRTFAYNPTLFNAAVFLAALYFLLRILRYGGPADYPLFGLFAGLSLWIRPTSPVYLAGLAFFLIAERRRLRPGGLAAALIPFLALGAGLLAFNRIYYGSFFQIGYTVSHQPIDAPLEAGLKTGLARIFDYLRFHPSAWLAHLSASPASLTMAFPPLALAALGIFSPRREAGEGVGFRRFFLFTFALALVFFANFPTYGYWDRGLNLHSSFLRYLVPAVALLPLLTVRFLLGTGLKLAVPVAVLAALNIIFALGVPFGMAETVLLSRYNDDCREFMLEETDPDTVFFTIYWDKVLLPERMVYTRGRHRAPGEEVLEAVRDVIDRGYRVAYPYHPSDSTTLEHLRSRYRLSRREGPRKLTFPLGRLVPFLEQKPDLYPLVLYLVEEELPQQPAPAGTELPPGEVDD